MRHYGDVNLEQAAATLGIRPDTLRHQIHNGRLRGRKMGRDWYVAESDVARYRAERLGRRKLNGGVMTEEKRVDESVAVPAVDPDAEDESEAEAETEDEADAGTQQEPEAEAG